MINTLRIGLFTLCALVALSSAPASAATFYFTGTCSDCPDIGEGVLTTTEVGNATTFNFSYVSDWISYTMSNAAVSVDGDQFQGTGFTIPVGLSLSIAQSGVLITSFGGTGNPMAAGTILSQAYFDLFANGNWQTGGQLLADFGTNGAFGPGNAVPEPSTLGLAGLSAGLLLLRKWRQQKA